MKKLLLIILMLLGSITWVYSQTATVSGKLTDVTGNPLPGVSVTIGITQVNTDGEGRFNATGIGYGKVDITFMLGGYTTVNKIVEVNSPAVDLGLVQLKQAGNVPEFRSEGNVTTLSSDDESKLQSVAGLLHSSNDIFVSAAGFALSDGSFRPRGYDSQFAEVLFNGLVLNDPETGRPDWSDWTGLNDVTRFKESAYGLSPSRFSFGTLGGTTDIDSHPSHYSKQFTASYAISDRSFQHRLMATYSTGLMKNGWAVMASGSARLATTGYVKGTPYQGGSYFLAIEKKINNNHSLTLTGFGAPTTKGMQSAEVQEVYDLLNDNYYNPNWGYQDGKVRSARIRTSHEPLIMLSHNYNIDDKTKLTTSVGYSFGRTSTSALNWYNSADPRPDYYRYLPSYDTSTVESADIAHAWQNDVNVRQINWDHLVQVNLLSNYTGEQAKYILEDRRLDHSQFILSSHFNREVNNNIFVSGGLNVNIYKSRNYKVIGDLLGGNYWVDVDQYAQRDFPSDTNILQDDLNHPNRVVKKGDVFGYDYDVHINTEKLWGLAEFNYSHFDFYVGLNLSGTQFWRVGNMKNGLFPDSSYGKSKDNVFYNYEVKAGITYKVTGRHFFVLNAGYFNVAPKFSDVYEAPRINDIVIPGINNKRIFSADLSYVIRTPRIQGRLTAYETMFWNNSKVMSFYDDDLQTFVDYVIKGINQTNKGIELGIEVKIIPSLFVTAVGAMGDYRYTNRPTAFTSVENGSAPDTNELIYEKNFYVSGTPQTAGSLGLKWQGPSYWFAEVNANVFANNWIDFNPSRRTVTALNNLGPDDPLIPSIIDQIKANDKPQFTLDASVGKSFRIKKYFIHINASVSNILNNKNMITSGFEQLRFNFTTHDISEFPPKYYYGYGITYFITASFRF